MPAHAGRGYATAIASALLDIAFTDLGAAPGHGRVLRRQCRLVAGHGEARACAREQHGVRDSWHAELGWVDGFTYAILAEEYAPVA